MGKSRSCARRQRHARPVRRGPGQLHRRARGARSGAARSDGRRVDGGGTDAAVVRRRVSTGARRKPRGVGGRDPHPGATAAPDDGRVKEVPGSRVPGFRVPEFRNQDSEPDPEPGTRNPEPRNHVHRRNHPPFEVSMRSLMPLLPGSAAASCSRRWCRLLPAARRRPRLHRRRRRSWRRLRSATRARFR